MHRLDPVDHRRDRQVDAVATVHRPLPRQRQVVGVLRHHHLREQPQPRSTPCRSPSRRRARTSRPRRTACTPASRACRPRRGTTPARTPAPRSSPPPDAHPLAAAVRARRSASATLCSISTRGRCAGQRFATVPLLARRRRWQLSVGRRQRRLRHRLLAILWAEQAAQEVSCTWNALAESSRDASASRRAISNSGASPDSSTARGDPVATGTARPSAPRGGFDLAADLVEVDAHRRCNAHVFL